MSLLAFDRVQAEADAELIRIAQEKERIHFHIDTSSPYASWIAWNVLDTYTTHRAISGGYARETNPFLPEYPSLERLIAQKLVINGLLYQTGFFENKDAVTEFNKLGWFVVTSNSYIIIKYE